MQISLTFLRFDRFEPNDSKNILRERFVNNFYCHRTKIRPNAVFGYLTDMHQNRPEFAFTGTQEIFSGFVIDSGT